VKGAVASTGNLAGKAGAGEHRAGWLPGDGCGDTRGLGVGDAEDGADEADSEAAAVATDRVPGLAGRVKRRPERRGRLRPPAVPYEAVLKLDAELCEASKGVARLRL
jgi:hypothetical protein